MSLVDLSISPKSVIPSLSLEARSPTQGEPLAQPAAATLLLVRHGRDRGPHIRLRRLRPPYLQPLLDDLAQRDPQLRSRIRVWETGSPFPDLSDVRALLFALQDPLRERFPACYLEAERLARHAQQLGVRLINPPWALSHSIKTVQARLWRAAGLPTPRHLPFANFEELTAAANQLGLPVIVRGDQDHSQAGMHYVADRAALDRLAVSELRFPGSVTQCIDTREGFAHTLPGSPWAKFFHKKRAFVFGDRVRNNHVFFGTHPIVGSRSCTFGHYRSLNPVRRWLGNRACREHLLPDWEYFAAGSEHEALLRQAARALDLEFVAIDYSSTADGGVMLWEANPHFSLHLWPCEVLPRERRLAERVRSFHDAMGEFFRGLIGISP